MDKSIQTYPPSSQRSQLRPQQRPTNIRVPTEIVVTQSDLARALFDAGLGPTMISDVTNRLFNTNNVESAHDLNSSLSESSFRSREPSLGSYADSVLSPISENDFVDESASYHVEARAVVVPASLVGDLDGQLEHAISLRIHDEQSSETGPRLQVFLQTATLPTKTLVLQVLRGEVSDFSSPLMVPELDDLLVRLIFGDLDGKSTSSGSTL